MGSGGGRRPAGGRAPPPPPPTQPAGGERGWGGSLSGGPGRPAATTKLAARRAVKVLDVLMEAVVRNDEQLRVRFGITVASVRPVRTVEVDARRALVLVAERRVHAELAG